jgi:hypothetical protein
LLLLLGHVASLLLVVPGRLGHTTDLLLGHTTDLLLLWHAASLLLVANWGRWNTQALLAHRPVACRTARAQALGVQSRHGAGLPPVVPAAVRAAAAAARQMLRPIAR